MKILSSSLPAAAVLAASLAMPATVAGGDATRPVAAKPPPATSEVVKPAVGGTFPDFRLPDVNGKEVSLSDFRGNAIILSFWSCFTDTCYTSVPVIKDLLAQYADRGLVAPTVCSEIPAALEADGYAGLLKNCGTGQIILVDKDMQLARSFGVKEFPTTYLIDRNYAVWQIIGGVRPLMQEDFRLLVKSLVAE
ncbi:MAG TPA: redoxin domain-containing protein [bacterium]